MAKFNQANFESAVISLIIDLSNTFAPGDAAFIEEFCIPAVGNAGHECGGFALMDEQAPTVQGSLGGISFFQWTGFGKFGRRKPFMDLCQQLHLHPYSYDAALAMVAAELKGPEKKAIGRTRAATVRQNTPSPKNILMARVVAFELAFERAGTKHYPGRYAYAVKAQQAWEKWVAAGMPPMPPYRSVPGSMSAKFDHDFGRPIAPPAPGIGKMLDPRTLAAMRGAPAEITLRPPGGGEIKITPDVVEVKSPGRITIAPADDDTADALSDTSGLPPVRRTNGKWPEQNLTPAEIKVVQQRLRDCGWVQVGKIDGSWGKTYTVPAVKAFQEKAGIDPDGHYGPDTRSALIAGVRFDAPPARTAATTEKLIAVGEPTTTAARSVKTTSMWTGISGVGAVVFSAVSQFAGDAWGVVSGIKDQVQDVPLWVWGAAVVAVAVFLYLKAQKIEAQRLAEERSGANTALAVPLPMSPMISAAEPWAGMRPGGGYQPGNDGTGQPVAVPATGSGVIPRRAPPSSADE
jgi:peptidoglycan hydrolase-like protein with peptidoglycan-binding domain